MALRKRRISKKWRTRAQLNKIAAELAGLMETGQLCLAHEEKIGRKSLVQLEMVTSIAINGDSLQVASFIPSKEASCR